MTNQAAVLTAPLMPFKTAGVPRKPSIDCSRSVLWKGRAALKLESGAAAGAANALAVASPCTPGSVVVVSGVTGVRTPAAIDAA